MPESPPSRARTRQWSLSAASWVWWVGGGGTGLWAEGQEEKMLFEGRGEGGRREAQRKQRTTTKKRDLAFIKHLPCVRHKISSNPQKRSCEKRTIRLTLWGAEREVQIVDLTCSGSHSSKRNWVCCLNSQLLQPLGGWRGRGEGEGKGEKKEEVQDKREGLRRGDQPRCWLGEEFALSP